MVPHVFVAGDAEFWIELQPPRQRVDEVRGVGGGVAGLGALVVDQADVAPDRFAVLAPVTPEGPARQRFAGIPLALSVVQQSAGGPFFVEAFEQVVGEFLFIRAERFGVPFRRVGSIERHERRFAAHREPHVETLEFSVDVVAQRIDRAPLFFGVGLGLARVFVDARDRHREFKFGFAFIDEAGDWAGAAGFSGAGQRDVAFAGEQAGSRVQADPACPGQKHFRPSVQIGEIFFSA